MRYILAVSLFNVVLPALILAADYSDFSLKIADDKGSSTFSSGAVIKVRISGSGGHGARLESLENSKEPGILTFGNLPHGQYTVIVGYQTAPKGSEIVPVTLSVYVGAKSPNNLYSICVTRSNALSAASRASAYTLAINSFGDAKTDDEIVFLNALKMQQAQVQKERFKILVPAFFQDEFGPDWQAIIDTNKDKENRKENPVSVWAIVNPADGPGQGDIRYPEVLSKAHTAGVTLLGYVAASKEIEKVNLNNEWKLREVDDIVGDIKTWKKLYHNEKKHPLTGFFLDNYPKHLKDSKGIEVRPKLIQLRDAIRKEFPGAVIVANPGTNVPDEYVENKVADALIGSETTLENGLQQMEKLPNWVGQDNKPEYGILFHHSPKNDKWKELFGKNAVPVTKLNFLYVEDTAAGKNEWTKLTSFWKEFVTEVGKLGR